MRVARTIAEVREHVAGARRAGLSIALVPTMGAFHAGHESLMRAAGEACDEVVVSLFVNPTQFDDAADFRAYPRVEDDDAQTAARHGAGLLFAPSAAEMYPPGFATTVAVSGLSDVLEGEHRPGHFAGVCTVVAKLLAIVGPDVAYFGRKDAQQVLVVRRMATDLNLPVRIEALPTVREADGLALSSRNRRLSPDERRRALALPRALAAAQRAIAAGERDPVRVRRLALAGASGVEFEYPAVVDPETLAEPAALEQPVLVAAAARVGDVRLIDNVLASPPAHPQAPPPAALVPAKETA